MPMVNWFLIGKDQSGNVLGIEGAADQQHFRLEQFMNGTSAIYNKKGELR